MLLAEKVQRVVEMTPAFLSEPEVYFSILSEVGEAINLFKSARRYILGQMKMNWPKLPDHDTAKLIPVLLEWTHQLDGLSTLERQIVAEIPERFLAPGTSSA